jgi:acetyl esterase/lipase
MRKRFTILWACLLAWGISAGTAAAQCGSSARYVADLYSIVNRSTSVYAVATNYLGLPQALEIDVYTPAFDQTHNRACIVYMHGGAFVAGDKRLPEAVDFCRYFARKGYVVASISCGKFRYGGFDVFHALGPPCTEG